MLIEPLIKWYRMHARNLPWRASVTPYGIWVSEIMLQQTRVEAVKPYYARFMEALPDIRALAECEEDRLLKLWEGLGYYNRVRNMQKAAQILMDEYGGEMPAQYEALLSLPGIGPYTAGAIASIAFGLPEPAVDGNVLRIFARVFADASDIAKPAVRRRLEAGLRETMREEAFIESDFTPGELNQALMELGATVCVPNGAPLCEECPWNPFCRAKADDRIAELPVKSGKKARRIEKRTVLIIRDEDRIVLSKRPEKGLLAGLYELPNVEGHLNAKEALATVNAMHLHPLHIQKLESAKHIFSHVEWHMTGYMIRVDSLSREDAEALFIEIRDQQKNYPVPSAFSAYMKYMTATLGKE